jgi:hypothetical protein
MYFTHKELCNKGKGSPWLLKKNKAMDTKSQTTHNPEHEAGDSEQQERGRWC